MTRLFAGTPFDQPPRCEACGDLEEFCKCPPPPKQWPSPERQTATVRLEKRKAKRVVTVVTGLKAEESDLPALVAQLKSACGAGGSLQGEAIEIQGDQVSRVTTELKRLGYRLRA